MTKIHALVAAAAAIALAGCGAETTGAAATGAAIKKQELEQGQRTLQQSRQKIEQAVQAQQRQVAD
jgi:hypothetical protein